MTTYRENDLIFDFQPYLLHIENPNRLAYELSHFAVPISNYGPGYRGVANISVPGNDPTKSIILHVYVKPGEDNKAVLALKKGNWVIKGKGVVPGTAIGAWIGYIEAPIEQGDPPIAVG